MNGFALHAVDDILNREEVTNFFGRKCNSRFLLSYGFMVLNNEQYNTVKFGVEFDKNDILMGEKQALIKQNPLPERECTIYSDIDIEDNAQMLSFLRFTILKRPEDLALVANLYHRPDEPGVSHDREAS